ncbi:MAG: decarboxylating NADP(+)-dependent phosphogluconate dehydrogenase [Oscillospiraceae bacterium]|jgi:6-phosphogluconate dehydrogenase|nr:decarboxylating NADP(+)-dependent phosphogluconate dehydrogenase [Oscillospiraceae bacterium]
MTKADFGIIGLAVMGENLARNLLSKGIKIAVYDRAPDRTVRAFLQRCGAETAGAYSLAELTDSLARPRMILMMIRAGSPVDEVIGQLLPLLEPGDILIDGGNSNFRDTIRRTRLVESYGLLYVGMGVSGGEEGALKGPSLMPGGSPAAWPHIQPILQAIAAQADGVPCCDWVGRDGAGHYIKMVHNGIEYGDMQLICEAYDLMRTLLCMQPEEMAQVFTAWNDGVLKSYLIKITAQILQMKDADESALVDKILDAAGQKGTGKWACAEALQEGVPLPLFAEAVFARCLAANRDQRLRLNRALPIATSTFAGDRAALLKDLEQALYAAKILSYAQGFSLMRAAARTHNWGLRYGSIALLWRGGCIIRSAFLGKIKEAFDREPDLENLMLDEYFARALQQGHAGLRAVCAAAALHGVPAPALQSALAYFDACRSARLPANLLQAQRDYFGAHTYERVDEPRGAFFHTNWTGEGGDTSATAYSV